MKFLDAQFLPVVHRELREGARRPFNYWLRVAAAAVGVFLLYSILKNSDGNPATAGLRLFTSLHTLMLWLIVLLVPAMGADCIAREKREGTLGLLFLTPLNAVGVVAGKGLMQAFRAFTLWLAVLPVIVIPFLSGGVAWPDVFSAISIEFCVTLLALVAGLLASSLATARNMAFILAECIGVGLVGLFAGLLGFAFSLQTLAPGQPLAFAQVWRMGQSLVTGQSNSSLLIGWTPFLSPAMSQVLLRGPVMRQVFISGPGGVFPSQSLPSNPGAFPGAQGPTVTRLSNGTMMVVWSSVSTMGPTAMSASGWNSYFANPATRAVWQPLLLESLLAVPLLCWLVLLVSARLVARAWRDPIPSLRRESWIKTFCLPRKRPQAVNHTLERNPVAWLQQYSWKARLSKWGLCLGILVVDALFSTRGPEEMLDAQILMLTVLFGCYTFAGVNGFLTEKKSGALELLLVTPLTADKIIFGRVWGLWKQFLPAGVSLLFLWGLAQTWAPMMTPAFIFGQSRRGMFSSLLMPLARFFLPDSSYSLFRPPIVNNLVPLDDPKFQAFVVIMAFLILPVLATYFALRVRNLIAAAALTWIALPLCLVFAFVGLALAEGGFPSSPDPAGAYTAVAVANLSFAMLTCFLLRHSLSRRIYSF